MTDTDEISQRANARIGTVLRGKWHLDGVLGVGGTSCVYAATHRNRSRVAIKMLHAEFATSRSIVQRFQREGYVVNGVGHPGIVQVVDDDVTEDGQPFLVMELLEGETIGERMERLGRLPPHEVAAIGCRVLEVLIAAHAHDIIHRDLKPDNVFLTRSGQLKVLDFGIARHRETAMDASGGTLQGSLLGTPGFMAPEQALGKWSEVDGRTDIWAVGATLFTVLTGCFTHEAGTVQQQLVLAATRRARRVHEVAPGAPAWLAAIIDRALEFEPAERFPDARTMLAALEEALRGVELPSLSVPEPPISLVHSPRFPEASTRSGESETVVSVQAMAHSTPRSMETPRRWPAVVAALALAAGVGAFVGISRGWSTDVTVTEPGPGSGRALAAEAARAPGVAAAPPTSVPSDVTTSPTRAPSDSAAARLEGAAAGTATSARDTTRVAGATSTTPQAVTPTQPVKGASQKSLPPVARRPDHQPAKRPDRDKPVPLSTPGENPFDSRH